MKAALFFLAAATAVRALDLGSLLGIPECGVKCTEDEVKKSGICPELSASCGCENRQRIKELAIAKGCSNEACEADIDGAFSNAENLCKLFG
ncbi:putative Cell wall protein [Seiridium cardinale]|uniref:Cell wall protein n=1 Tax=Seiridium cardinale TaxID=138064 RepID=A0ABR2X7M0_9PEZI